MNPEKPTNRRLAKQKPVELSCRSWYQIWGYRFVQFLLSVNYRLLYRFKKIGKENIPEEGPAVMCANHQSHHDPTLVGCELKRRMNYLARKTLFESKGLGWLIGFLDAIPLDQEGMGIAGIKETLKRLKRGEMVLVFPEGTRSADGELKKFQPGFLVLARRTKSPLIPAGVDGTFKSWPKGRTFPRPSRVAVSYGTPITYEQYQDLDDEQLIELLRQRIIEEIEKAKQVTGNA